MANNKNGNNGNNGKNANNKNAGRGWFSASKTPAPAPAPAAPVKGTPTVGSSPYDVGNARIIDG